MKKFSLAIATVFLGGLLLSGVALAADLNGQNDTPLLLQETHGYYSTQSENTTNSAVPNHNSMSADQYRSYIESQTSPGTGYGGQGNIPLNVQNLR